MKAGDGGNGRRGADGEGGRDSTNSAIAPTSGTYAQRNSDNSYVAGTAGSAGTAFIIGSGSDEAISTENEGTLSNGSIGSTGSRGNDGWGGLNLNRYEINRSGFTGLSHLQNAFLNAGIDTIHTGSSQTQIGIQMEMVAPALDPTANRKVTLDNYILRVDVPRNRVWDDGELIEGIHKNDNISINVTEAYLNALTNIISSVNSKLQAEMYIIGNVLSAAFE